MYLFTDKINLRIVASAFLLLFLGQTALMADSRFTEEFVLVPGGSFLMGDTRDQGTEIEKPVHPVSVSSFYIGKHLVTQSQWESLMGTNPARANGIGPQHPVYYVSWYHALIYCNTRSMAEGLQPVYRLKGSTDPKDWGRLPRLNNNLEWDAVSCDWNANGYRLPTEAEWEFAARGGKSEPDFLYSGGEDIERVAWYSGNNRPEGTKPVGLKEPNALGLYDMSGNLWEWCWNWYNVYDEEPKVDPRGSLGGAVKVFRGGSWYGGASNCRVSARNFAFPSFIHHFVGLRLVRNAD